MPEHVDMKKWEELMKQEFQAADPRDRNNGSIINGSKAHSLLLKKYMKHILEKFLGNLKKKGVDNLHGDTLSIKFD